MSDPSAFQALLARSVIVSTNPEGLSIDTGGELSFLPWADILLILAGIIDHEGRMIMMLAFETRDGRVLLLAEVDKAWAGVTEALDRHLPSVPPFSVWAAQILQSGDSIPLYDASA